MFRRRRMGCDLKKRRGNSLIEFSFLMPWFFFLFVGVFDFGFYDYSLIALQDGLRVAALNAAQNSSLAGNSATACTYVLAALKYLPNIGTSVTTCSASPITVTATYGSGTGPDGGSEATVSATYTTPQMTPIPGLLSGQYTITRTLQMRLP
jgi:Flp pilus assembly protein TadG